MNLQQLIKKCDELYLGYVDPFAPSARFFKAEEMIKLWPEIREYLEGH